MKALLFTAAGEENLGDELIALQEIRFLLKENPDLSLTLFSHHPVRTERFFRSQDFHSDKVTIKQYFPDNIRQFPLKNITLFLQTLLEFFQCDQIYIGGGGLLYDSTEEGHSPLKIWNLRLRIAKFMKKPVTYLSLGITAQGKKLQPFGKNLFQSTIISVRDTNSQEKITQLGFTGTLLPDPVLTYEGEKIPQKKKHIGIAFRKGFMNDEKIHELIKALLREDYEVVLLPHSLHPEDEKSHDGYFLQDFLLPGVIVSQSIEETLLWYQKCHIIFSMRLHSMILAICHHMPFIGISYGEKTSSLLQALQWDFSFSPDTTTDIFLKSLEKIENNYHTFSEQLDAFHTKAKKDYQTHFPIGK